MKFGLSVNDIPELMAMLRRELAGLIRDVAEGEPAAVRERLHEIAAMFEAGVTKK